MAYLSIDEIKHHLNIEDTRYFEEDEYLRHLGEVAEQAVEQQEVAQDYDIANEHVGLCIATHE